MRVSTAVAISFAAMSASCTAAPQVDPKAETAAVRARVRLPAEGAAQAELKRLQDDWARAYVALDTTLVGKLLAPDYFVVTNETEGNIADRQRALAAVLRHSPDWPIYAYDQEDVEVRVYGDAAIVTGISTLRMKHAVSGNLSDVKSRYVHVWVRREGQWQLVSRQATPVGST